MSCEIYVRQAFTANHILFKLYFNATYKQGVFDHFCDEELMISDV